MKIAVVTMLLMITLSASMFKEYPKTEVLNIKNKFVENVSDANAVIKRGNFERYSKYENGIQNTIKHVDKLDISQEEKVVLKNDLKKYAEIINKLYKKLHSEAPEFHKHYKSSVNGLKKFNEKLSSIGYRPLLNLWYELSKTKSKFIRRPSQKLQKEFYKNYKLMLISISELYLDEEIEEPLFSYLENYKTHFDELSMGYESIGYKDVKSIKPLSYKIKAKMEFISPIKL
jgi:hypothetical protein